MLPLPTARPSPAASAQRRPASGKPVAGLGTAASRRAGTGAAVTGPDVEPDVLPDRYGVLVVGRRVEVFAAADRPAGRTRTFTSALGVASG